MPETGVRAYAASRNGRPPRRLGQRYDAERFLPDPGNTVVCHLDPDAPGAEAVLAARARMKELPGAERFLFTPADSLHMTLFEGVLDNRRVADAWPDWSARDAPVAAVSAGMLERLRDFAAPGRFAVRATRLRPVGLDLAGVTAADEAVMRAWRDRLAEVLGYRQAVHDAYGFHMTFAYPVDWLPDAVVPVWEAGLRRIEADLAREVPVLPLRAPAFCRFADMTWFEELAVLG